MVFMIIIQIIMSCDSSLRSGKRDPILHIRSQRMNYFMLIASLLAIPRGLTIQYDIMKINEVQVIVSILCNTKYDFGNIIMLK